jgi:hypothetical protein
VNVGAGLKQIPQIAIEILEYGNRAVTLHLGRPNKDNTLGFVSVVVAPEIIGVEKQEHPAPGLISYSR